MFQSLKISWRFSLVFNFSIFTSYPAGFERQSFLDLLYAHKPLLFQGCYGLKATAQKKRHNYFLSDVLQKNALRYADAHSFLLQLFWQLSLLFFELSLRICNLVFALKTAMTLDPNY